MKAAAVKKRRKKSIFLRIALAAFSIYVVVTLLRLQLQISDRQKQISELSAMAEQYKKEVEELQHKNDNYEDYLEEKARENMARQGETIYIGN